MLSLELSTAAWYASNSGNRTHPVGQKKPNSWGLVRHAGERWGVGARLARPLSGWVGSGSDGAWCGLGPARSRLRLYHLLQGLPICVSHLDLTRKALPRCGASAW